MGYAVIMFVMLLIVSVVMVTAVTYGVVKDSQIAPLKAKNVYAERETGKAQTGLTIVNTCLDGESRYTKPALGLGLGPLTLSLTLRNSGSIVLNPTKVTILYNASYSNSTATSGNVWTPLTNASLQVPNIYIDPISPLEGPELGLLAAAENGVSTIAPTSPTNFNGAYNSSTKLFAFTWNASKDDKGLSYYIIYQFNDARDLGYCPVRSAGITRIEGNQTSSSVQPVSGGAAWFFLVAVDIDGNMGIPSRTLQCPLGQSCSSA